jgi:two-component system sensor histidine kinase QseC
VLGEVLQHMPRPAGIEIEVADALSDLKLTGEREALHLVLRNLHENAVEHMPQGGRVIWRSCAGGLCVEDEGPGIPPEEMARVTERFFRGRHKSASGTGLGLTIATMAAARLGARLRIENREDRPGVRAALVWG